MIEAGMAKMGMMRRGMIEVDTMRRGMIRMVGIKKVFMNKLKLNLMRVVMTREGLIKIKFTKLLKSSLV